MVFWCLGFIEFAVSEGFSDVFFLFAKKQLCLFEDRAYSKYDFKSAYYLQESQMSKITHLFESKIELNNINFIF